MGNTTRAFKDNYVDLTEVEEDAGNGGEFESDSEDLLYIDDNQPTNPRKRKSVSLCQHKLQGRTDY